MCFLHSLKLVTSLLTATMLRPPMAPDKLLATQNVSQLLITEKVKLLHSIFSKCSAALQTKINKVATD